MPTVFGDAVPATSVPASEATTPAVGTMMTFARADHTHPRLSSATAHVTDANGEAVVTFTRTFAAPPCLDFTYIEAADNPPVFFKIKSYIQDGQGQYVGCVARAYRGQTLPTSILTLLALVSFNVFGGNVNGITFTALAIQRS